MLSGFSGVDECEDEEEVSWGNLDGMCCEGVVELMSEVDSMGEEEEEEDGADISV